MGAKAKKHVRPVAKEAPDATLTGVVWRDHFQEANQHVFPTLKGMVWFMKVHWDALVAAGAVGRMGHRIYVRPKEFNEVFAVITSQLAEKRAVRSEAQLRVLAKGRAARLEEVRRDKRRHTRRQRAAARAPA